MLVAMSLTWKLMAVWSAWVPSGLKPPGASGAHR
jgi:hypothetical protein